MIKFISDNRIQNLIDELTKMKVENVKIQYNYVLLFKYQKWMYILKRTTNIIKTILASVYNIK